ncbi:cation:proton antiporter, partial [Staphylococcus epidermidis]|nr:cation:proton antiporter [Staphylococcus epidermidis]
SAVIMCIVGVVSVIYDTDAYLDSIMLIAIISFVSSVSISRFIGGGRVFNGTHKKRH